MRLCEQAASLFAPAEGVVSRLRAVARFARTSCVVLLSVVSSFYPCVGLPCATHLTAWLKKIALVTSSQFIHIFPFLFSFPFS